MPYNATLQAPWHRALRPARADPGRALVRPPRQPRRRPGRRPHRRALYTTKREPAYADMHASLRRTIIAARFSPATPGTPTDDEIRAVMAAWAAAEPALTA